MSQAARTVLFGAFDRHNFGDLLFAHVLARLLAPREPVFAGLVTRDLRAFGGHAVHAIGEIAAGQTPVDLIHAGGELLTCNAWEAAVMLTPPERVQSMIEEESAWCANPLAWSRQQLGIATRSPYVLSKSLLPRLRIARIAFHAMGGAALDQRDNLFQQEVIDKLQHADAITVRDAKTQMHLQTRGIDAPVTPDPAVMVADLFGAHIAKRATQTPLDAIKSAFPQGFSAIQFDASYSDDATLDVLARELSRMAQEENIGIVLFCAGIAPWHDDRALYERLKQRLPIKAVLFDSLDIWDICALIASSRVYAGSSLHGRIVAMAFARPRINIVHREYGDQPLQPPKQAAFAATWEPEDVAATTYVDQLADAVHAALRADPGLLHDTASDLVRRYRAAFAASAL
ncbi:MULTISPECIES: polysaccharide pyruvyl transferase family protein [unclassified Paraburkholderia]|uniref:polysaccharide pyruvyl transferase family protein n=1 Tax=unclassified Paraburkholderia TaxID=2615204 RepID=UPI002AB2E018|nr:MULTISPECIES: polysaccharide pyruvyl transferase family protein [unclassified Paraburkholderia]